MTSKELLYVEDALGHEQYFQTKCEEAQMQLQDERLRHAVSGLQQEHRNIFNSFISVLN